MNVYERINREVSAAPEDPTEAIVDRVARICSKADLLPLLGAAVDLAKRGLVNREEKQYLARLVASLRPTQLPSVPEYDSTELLSLLRRTIKLGDGSATTWGLATVDEHRQRLAMLVAQRNGLNDTIRRHEEAIRILEESGAPCLAVMAQRQGVAA